MNIWLDMIGSMVVAGAVLLMVLNLNGQLLDRGIVANLTTNAQESGALTMAVLQKDLWRAGLAVPSGGHAILQADGTTLTFLGDLDEDTVADTVTYALGPLDASTTNPKDRRLTRTVGSGNPLPVGIGVVSDSIFSYFNKQGRATARPESIAFIAVTMRVETPEPLIGWDPVSKTYVPQYPGSDWTARVRPKNL